MPSLYICSSSFRVLAKASGIAFGHLEIQDDLGKLDLDALVSAEAGKAVVGSFAAATMASIEESKTRAAAAAKLIKAGISAAKIKAKRTATAAATLGKDYLECAKAAVSLAGTIASAAIKLTGVVMAECWKTILDFGTVSFLGH